jgi:hypothetical protein
MFVWLRVIVRECTLYQPAASDRGSPGNGCADLQELSAWESRRCCHLGRLLNVGLLLLFAQVLCNG